MRRCQGHADESTAIGLHGANLCVARSITCSVSSTSFPATSAALHGVSGPPHLCSVFGVVYLLFLALSSAALVLDTHIVQFELVIATKKSFFLNQNLKSSKW